MNRASLEKTPENYPLAGVFSNGSITFLMGKIFFHFLIDLSNVLILFKLNSKLYFMSLCLVYMYII